LEKVDGTQVTIWKGSQDVDLATTTSLLAVANFKGDIPAGVYKKFKLFCAESFPKVKGSISVSGTTYYTKANHTNYTTGPAELEELKIVGWGAQYAIEQTFSPPVQLGGAFNNINVLVDLAYGLIYWDGNGENPIGSVNGTTAGMYLPLPAHAITFGAPAKKEVYEYDISTTVFPSSPGRGRMTLLFNSDDKLVGASVKSLLLENVPSGGVYFKLYSSLADAYGSTPSPEAFQKNADGTYTIKMGKDIATTNYSNYVVFSNFQRASHTGNFSYKDNSTGETVTGTYTCTKIQ
jgi:hypothetical protein